MHTRAYIQALDRDGDGRISVGEFARGFQSLYQSASVRSFSSEMELNNDGDGGSGAGNSGSQVGILGTSAPTGTHRFDAGFQGSSTTGSRASLSCGSPIGDIGGGGNGGSGGAERPTSLDLTQRLSLIASPDMIDGGTRLSLQKSLSLQEDDNNEFLQQLTKGLALLKSQVRCCCCFCSCS